MRGGTENNRLAILAKGRLKRGEQNGTEQRYNRYLDERVEAGEVAWYRFEGITLNLAPGVSYRVDFFVMLANGDLEAHEVKGKWEDDARLKIKLAQSLFPFRFIAIKPVPTSRGGGWEIEDFEKMAAPLLPGMRVKKDVPPPKKRVAKPDSTTRCGNCGTIDGCTCPPPPLRRKKPTQKASLL